MFSRFGAIRQTRNYTHVGGILRRLLTTGNGIHGARLTISTKALHLIGRSPDEVMLCIAQKSIYLQRTQPMNIDTTSRTGLIADPDTVQHFFTGFFHDESTKFAVDFKLGDIQTWITVITDVEVFHKGIIEKVNEKHLYMMIAGDMTKPITKQLLEMQGVNEMAPDSIQKFFDYSFNRAKAAHLANLQATGAEAIE